MQRQRGASLLEGIAFLGIAAIVVLGAVSLLNGAFGSAATNRTAEEIVAIRTSIKKLYMGQSAGYPGGSASMNAQLVPANVFPSTLTVNTGTSTVTNSWAGAVNVTSPTATTFQVEYTAVPQDVCINVVSTSSGWTGITVNGTAMANPTSPDPTTAQAACTSTTSNTIDWQST